MILNGNSSLTHVGTTSIIKVSHAINITNKILSETIEVMFNKAFSLHINQREVTENYYRLLETDPNYIRLISLDTKTEEIYCDFYLKAYDIFTEILKRKPNHIFSLEFRAAIKHNFAFYVSGDRELIDESLIEFEKANELCPSFFSYYYLGLRNHYFSIEHLSNSIEMYPMFSKSYYYRGFARDDNVGKIADFSKAIELDPNNQDIYFELAKVKAKATSDYHSQIYGTYEDCLSAINDLTIAIELTTNSNRSEGVFRLRRCFRFRSRLKEHVNDIPGAIDDQLKDLELSDDFRDYDWISLGDLKMKNKDYQGAINAYEKVVEENGLENLMEYTLYKIGEAKYQNNDFFGAEQLYTMIIEKEIKNNHSCKIEPFIKKAFLQRKLARQKLGDKVGFREDERNIKKIEYNEQGSSLCSRLDYAFQLMFFGFFYGGDYDWCYPSEDKDLFKLYNEALNCFNLAIETDSSFSTSYFNRGRLNLRFGYFKEALTDFTKVIELDKNFETIHFFSGISKLKLNDYVGAIEDFTSEIESDLEKNSEYISQKIWGIEVFYYRGVARYEINDFTGAIHDIEKALENGTEMESKATHILGLAKLKIVDNKF